MRRHGFRNERKKKPFLLKLAIFLVIVWGVTGTYLYYSANKNLKEYKLNNASKNVKWLKRLFYRHSNVKEMENILFLLNNKKPKHSETGKLSNEVYKEITLNYIKNQFNLDGFHNIYNYLNSKNIDLPFIKGLYLFDTGDFEKAKVILEKNKYFSKIFEKMEVPVVNNYIYYDLNNKEFISKTKELKFLTNHFNKKRHFLKVYETTLNKSLQLKTNKILGKFNGAVLLSENNELKMCVGKNIDVFSKYFEPASVIKLVTATALLSENPNLINNPYYCNKPLNFSGKIFYDWKKHGKLKSIEEAIACSCNLYFGEAGVKLGGEIMNNFYNKYYLDKNKTINIGEINFNIGRKRIDFDNAYSLANASIGLDIPEISAFWLIKTATTIENNGIDTIPTLFSSYSILGISENIKLKEKTKEQLIKTDVIEKLKKGMKKTVQWKNGTGYRANIDGVDIYLKTGTGGKRPFNSVLLGFFTKNNKTYSFGIYLEKGGKADKNGAKALKELISIL